MARPRLRRQSGRRSEQLAYRFLGDHARLARSPRSTASAIGDANWRPAVDTAIDVSNALGTHDIAHAFVVGTDLDDPFMADQSGPFPNLDVIISPSRWQEVDRAFSSLAMSRSTTSANLQEWSPCDDRIGVKLWRSIPFVGVSAWKWRNTGSRSIETSNGRFVLPCLDRVDSVLAIVLMASTTFAVPASTRAARLRHTIDNLDGRVWHDVGERAEEFGVSTAVWLSVTSCPAVAEISAFRP